MHCEGVFGALTVEFNLLGLKPSMVEASSRCKLCYARYGIGLSQLHTCLALQYLRLHGK